MTKQEREQKIIRRKVREYCQAHKALTGQDIDPIGRQWLECHFWGQEFERKQKWNHKNSLN